MTPEAKVRNPVVKWAKAHGILHIRMHMGRGTAAGWPDDLFIKDGVVVLIEFKRPGKAPTPLQWRRLTMLAQAGMRSFTYDDAEAAILRLRVEFKL